MLSTRLLYRVAHCVCSPPGPDEQNESGPEAPLFRFVHAGYMALEVARKRLRKARSHGISLILPMLQAEMLARARHLRRQLESLEGDLEATPPKTFSVASVAAELRQLEVEFGSVTVHRRQKAISINTEPITLGDVELGPFAIKLFWERDWEGYHVECFEVIALEPNPASSDECVTHPHVKDKVLCAGNAKPALRKALEQKRLADAFCLVRSVLLTYNPDSPHVSLSEWGGKCHCHDCGASVRADDAWICDRCTEDFCSYCIGECKDCHVTRCANCTDRCVVCKEPVCERCLRQSAHSTRMSCCKCLTSCPRCNRLVAKDELDNPQSCPTRRELTNPTTLERENVDETNEPATAGVS
jgi:hypothetical protein